MNKMWPQMTNTTVYAAGMTRDDFIASHQQHSWVNFYVSLGVVPSLSWDRTAVLYSSQEVKSQMIPAVQNAGFHTALLDICN